MLTNFERWNEKTNEVRSGQIKAGKGSDYWIIKFGGVTKNGDHNVEDKKRYNGRKSNADIYGAK